jgi:hypothetical protein
VNASPVLDDRPCPEKTDARYDLCGNSGDWFLPAGHPCRDYSEDRCAETYQNVGAQARGLVHNLTFYANDRSASYRQQYW